MARWRASNLLEQRIIATSGRRIAVRGQHLLNFASCDYLGLSLDRRIAQGYCLGARRSVTLGVPRILGTDPLTDQVEASIARLVGQERALIFPSTVHAASDVMPVLAGSHGVIFIDERAYPISIDAARKAERFGTRVCQFAHNDHRALGRLLGEFIHVRDKVIVCDGVYVTGETAQVDQFVKLAQAHHAVLYVDDAHGVGVLGARTGGATPLGSGGAGTPAYFGVPKGNVVHVGGLSKAFGVPIAFVAGPGRFIEYLNEHAATFIHSSQPATPVLNAALVSLDVHARDGEFRRGALHAAVDRFRAGLVSIGHAAYLETSFPIQSVMIASPSVAIDLATALRKMGLWAILQLAPPDNPPGAALRFLISAAHQQSEIDAAVAKLREAIGNLSRPCAYRLSAFG
jgi:8-amino-7-oxononanoate synthase